MTLLARLFRDRDPLIGRDLFEDLRPAAEPADFDPVDVIARSQAKMKLGPVVALVTSSSMHLGHLHQIAGSHRDVRADAVPIRNGPSQANLEPVVLAACIIAKHGGRLA